jgi:DNA (cytosine-5)-methyltransferase 1
MIGVDIFSGVGGMSIGAIAAGIDVRLAIELDSNVALTYVSNHPNTTLENKDIREVKEINVYNNSDTILFGGPPCQGFSRSNLKTRNIKNQNNWLFEEFIRVAKIWRPDWIVIENVKGLLETEKGIFLKNILQNLVKLEYKVSYQVLNASQFGVPQNRERLFIVAYPKKKRFLFPNQKNKTIVAVKEAIYDLPTLENGNKIDNMAYKCLPLSEYVENLRGTIITSTNHGVSQNEPYVIERYRHIPQGGNWKNIPVEFMSNYKDTSRCHTGIYHRIDENKPSVVIGNYRKNMLIHPVEHRGLSVREAARLQSFPDNFIFKGPLVSQQQQVGNAVPPLLAKVVFESVLNAL